MKLTKLADFGSWTNYDGLPELDLVTNMEAVARRYPPLPAPCNDDRFTGWHGWDLFSDALEVPLYGA